MDLNLKHRLTMRPYQESIVQNIINNISCEKPYVLASCPSSGKTEMAIEVIVRMLETKRINKILILAHSTNILKENFYERLMQYFNIGETVDIVRGQRRYNKNAMIQVMIPQNIKYVVGYFDLIIVDEAHHNVLVEDGNFSKILETIKPKYQLYLTGTPSKYIRENDKNGKDIYTIKAIGMDLIGFDNFHDVRFDLIKSDYGFTNDDYNRSKNISDKTHFLYNETKETINNVIVGAVKNIALRNGITLSKSDDIISVGKELIKQRKFGKTLIMCRNIEQANQVKKIISKIFNIRVNVSESNNDTESNNLKKFKNNEFDFLCVVNRAREGYDDKDIVNLIDITMTHNIDLIYQMFCRVVRKDIDNKNHKLYLKVTSNADGMPEYTMNITTAALMLGCTNNLSKFNGSNFRNIIIPKIERNVNFEDNETVNGTINTIDNTGKKIQSKTINNLLILDLLKLFSNDHINLSNGNDRYAMTTLGESLDILRGDITHIDKEYYYDILRNEKINSSHELSKNIKYLSKKYNMKFSSKPWMAVKMTIKQFFDECYQYKYIDKNGYFDIFKKENIKSGLEWSLKYKQLSDKYHIKYNSHPWRLFNMSAKDFLTECYPDKMDFLVDIIEYFKVFRYNSITGSRMWFDKYKDLCEKDNIKYNSQPWRIFNLSIKDFFEEYKKWLVKNPKKIFDPEDISIISKINKMGRITSATKMNKFFNENPQEFHNYHKLRKEKMAYWKEAPYEEIAKNIKQGEIVIDLGCGSGDLQNELPNNKVTSIDHIAYVDSVIACDMCDISSYVEDESHDVAVFSLSLWGTHENKMSYLKEAFRVLKRKGLIYIAETTGEDENLEEKQQYIINLLKNSKFSIIGDVDVREKFMYISAIKL